MSRGQNREIKKDQNRGMTPERRRRINRLKKIILWTVLLMILLPLMGCIVLGVKLYRKGRSAEAMAEQVIALEDALQDCADERDRTEALLRVSEENRQREETQQAPETWPETKESPEEPEAVSGNDVEAEPANRKVYFTFDDGPSIYTEEVLDILAEYDVKATFFVTGKGKEKYGDIYRRIVEEGHTLGMHSYSHEYQNIYASLEDFQRDLGTLRDYLYNETGVASRFYRFPGGSSNNVSRTDIHELAAYLNAMGISYFDWNISAGDATNAPVSSDQIVNRVMGELPSHQVAVVLMHDAAGKHSTVEALPKLIEAIRALDDGTEILPITEETMLIQHVAAEQE